MGFFVCYGFMFYPYRYYIELTFTDVDNFMLKVNLNIAFDDLKKFIFVFMAMPDKFTFELGNFQILPILLTNDFW
jgi:hypothetical protein